MKFSLPRHALRRLRKFTTVLSGFLPALNAISQSTGVVGWGFNNNGQANAQIGLTDVTGVTAGGGQSFALRGNGTVVTWGFPLNPPMPPGLRDISVIEAGRAHLLAIRSNGTVLAWGENTSGEITIPPGLSNVVAVSGGSGHSLAVTSDGTVSAWGNNSLGQSTVPAGLSNVIAVSAGGNPSTAYSVALKSDGTVVAWGDNRLRQTQVPPGLSNVVAIEASPFIHTVALKSDGTVAVWGVGLLTTNVPRGLTNVVAISAGSGYSLALRADGTIVGWGDNSENELNVPPSARNVSAIASGWFHNVAVVRSSPPRWPRISQQPPSQRTLAGQPVTMSVSATSAAPITYRWQFRGRTIPGATNAVLHLESPQLSDAGDYAVVLSADGLSVRSAPAFLAVSSPPVAMARVSSPTFYSSVDPAHVVVLAPDNAGAVVFLDGSLSEDLENNPLEFFWFEFEEAIPFATGVRVTNNLEVGQHSIVLRVSDGNGVATTSVTIEVITPGEGIDEILPMFVNEPALRGKGRPMVASLKAAIASFDRGNTGAGLNQLNALQNKIRSQIGRVDPGLAEELFGVVERIAELLESSARIP